MLKTECTASVASTRKAVQNSDANLTSKGYHEFYRFSGI